MNTPDEILAQLRALLEGSRGMYPSEEVPDPMLDRLLVAQKYTEKAHRAALNKAKQTRHLSQKAEEKLIKYLQVNYHMTSTEKLFMNDYRSTVCWVCGEKVNVGEPILWNKALSGSKSRHAHCTPFCD